MKYPARLRGRKAGFTLLEVLITLALLGLVTSNLYMILGQSSDALSEKTYLHDTEVQARRTLDRITQALLGASQDTLYLTPAAPFSTPWLRPKKQPSHISTTATAVTTASTRW